MGEIEWKEYQYTLQIGPFATVFARPLIDIEVSSRTSSEKISLVALVDSGTDGVVLSADIARVLGINPEHCSPAHLQGIGSIDGFASNVTIKIPGFNVAMNVTAVFGEGFPFSAILGQRDFFERFKVRFEKDQGKFYLASV